MTVPLNKYVGQFIVLITNDNTSRESIEGLRINGITHLYSYPVDGETKFVLTRALTKEDLHEDNEEYINYLQNQWESEQKIQEFLTNKVKLAVYKNGRKTKKLK
ncbi:MAG: hypothetical protein ACW98F_00165 [Candidatus Hodarchaeales archaeon]|jgi:hypothetical protein